MKIEIKTVRPTTNYRDEILIEIAFTEEEAYNYSTEKRVYLAVYDWLSAKGYVRIRPKVQPHYQGEHIWLVKVSGKYMGGQIGS